MIAVELRKMFRRPRTWATIAVLNALPIARRGAAGAHRPGPAARARGRRSCPPSCATARCTRWPRWPSCCRCSCRSRSPWSPATRSPARRRPAPCATCSPARPGGPGCWWPSWSRVMAFVLVTVLVVAGGRLRRSGRRCSTPSRSPARRCSGTSLTPQELGGRTVLAIGYVAVSMLGVAAFALFFSTFTDSPLGATMGALAVLVASSLLFTLDAASPIAPYLPTRYWLAFVDFFRDPILWRDIERGARRCRASTSGCCWRRPGRTSRPRTSRAEPCSRRARAVGRAQLRPGRRRASSASTIACTSGSRGSSPWPTRASAQTDCTGRFTAPSRRAESGGVTVWSCVVQIDTHGRPGRRLVAGVEPASRSLPVASCRQPSGHWRRRQRRRPGRRAGCRGAGSRA